MHCAKKKAGTHDKHARQTTQPTASHKSDRGLPRRTKLLAAGLYVRARGEKRLGSTSTPRLKYGAWKATPPTPVSASLRSQNGWRLEAPSRLGSTRRRMRTKPNAHSTQSESRNTPPPHATHRPTARDSALPSLQPHATEYRCLRRSPARRRIPWTRRGRFSPDEQKQINE